MSALRKNTYFFFYSRTVVRKPLMNCSCPHNEGNSHNQQYKTNKIFETKQQEQGTASLTSKDKNLFKKIKKQNKKKPSTLRNGKESCIIGLPKHLHQSSPWNSS